MVSFLAGIVETITNFFQQLVDSGYLTLDYIFYVSIALELILIVFFLVKSTYSYELRLDRTLDGLNRWLYYNQYIDESNLIEFNQRIKKAPKLLRYHWQQFMLYRDSEPSKYMSEYNCIEKPLHTSSFKSNIKNLASICYTLSITTFVLNLASFASVGQTNIGYVLLNSLLTPISLLLFSTFFTILLRSWQNANLSGLYQNFHLFTRYIDKGCTTLPEYIDFEVLFTKEEIKKGIPVLNEYLEKRARQEQKELEQAMLNSVEHEEYDFVKLGLNGSQILDRAMRETEIYLNQRQRISAEIQQLESEIESAKRNYENNQKEYERKMQASKENVDRLRKQQEESTNRIESNYIRKQQTDEIKKQEQLEKDYESATLRYNQEVLSLTSEINTRKLEIEEKKKAVEEAMKAEYNTFSTKVFKAISKDVDEKEKDEKTSLIEEKDSYQKALEQATITLDEKDKEIEKLEQIIKSANIDLGEYGDFYDENLRKEADLRKGKKKTKEEIKVEAKPEVAPEYDEYGGYYDSEGYYRYKNGTYYDPEGNFFDEFGGHYDKDGNYFPPQDATPVEQAPVAEIKEEALAEQDDVVYDEFGGYYDGEGNYRYKNGTYYDAEGNFHDEFGGYYDKDRNYFPPEEKSQEPVVEEVEAVEEEQPTFNFEPVEEMQEATEEESDEAEEIDDEVQNTSDDSDAEETSKKGRGRPRKEITEVVEEDDSPKRGRGRPKKEPFEEDEKPVVKAGRGRPRKETTEEEEEGKKAAKKAGRGRPRKEKSEEDEKPKTGKRGRPKKSDLTELEELNSKIEQETANLEKQQKELQNQIESTISELDTLPDDDDSNQA